MISVDCGFDLASGTHVPVSTMTVIRPSVDGFPQQTFLQSDTSILASPQACLNDTCINSCAAFLYSAFLPAAASCAILSTHDLPRIRHNADNDTLWRNVSWTRFWEKPVCILPIHCPLPVGHWVLCTIYFCSRQVLLFDIFLKNNLGRRTLRSSRPHKLIPY